MPELGDDATPAVQADPELIAAVALARGALAEITPESTIGEPLGYEVEESGAVSLFFECRIPGYPGWHWTVTVGRAGDDAEPTVLEAELMPGDGALLAPDWVPWSDRLADYQAAQEAHAVPKSGSSVTARSNSPRPHAAAASGFGVENGCASSASRVLASALTAKRGVPSTAPVAIMRWREASSRAYWI